MACNIQINVQEQDFTLDQLANAASSRPGQAGALVVFTGMVRDFNEDSNLKGLFLEHYPGMTEKSLHKIAEEAASRWDLLGVSVVHRIGELLNAENIVGVAVRRQHRKNAFQACEFIMDYLKTEAPFWKKEITESGADWVKAKKSDDDERERWR